jgi:hypothetical protein
MPVHASTGADGRPALTSGSCWLWCGVPPAIVRRRLLGRTGASAPTSAPSLGAPGFAIAERFCLDGVDRRE